jgi:hypothetical protein
VLLAASLAGCAQGTRIRRVFAPESFVTVEEPAGVHAEVTVDAGWEEEAPAPYRPSTVSTDDDETWYAPQPLTDRAVISVEPGPGGAEVALYSRHVGLVERDFQRVVARSGTLRGEIATAVRFLPEGPLEGPWELEVRDLQSVYSDDRLEDGDLLLLEVTGGGGPPERYLFRLYDFGLHTRAGAGLLVRLPIPFVQTEAEQATLTPALTASLSIGYRPRTRNPAANFLTEQVAAVVSVGIGSTVLEEEGLQNQISGAFNAALVGGGIEVLQMFTVQILGNASAPFRDDLESGWALAVGFDAVQFGRFAKDLSARLFRESPLAEERAE